MIKINSIKISIKKKKNACVTTNSHFTQFIHGILKWKFIFYKQKILMKFDRKKVYSHQGAKYSCSKFKF